MATKLMDFFEKYELLKPNKKIAFYSGLIAGCLSIIMFHVFDIRWIAIPIQFLIFALMMNAFIGLANLKFVFGSFRKTVSEEDVLSPVECMERFWRFAGGLFISFLWIMVFPPD